MIVQLKKASDGTLALSVTVDSLDRSNAPDFREATTPAVASSTGVVVVDCSQLEFIDSSGLGALLNIHNLLPEERRPVRLSNVGTKVLASLELMQVHRIFELEPRK